MRSTRQQGYEEVLWARLLFAKGDKLAVAKGANTMHSLQDAGNTIASRALCQENTMYKVQLHNSARRTEKPSGANTIYDRKSCQD